MDDTEDPGEIYPVEILCYVYLRNRSDPLLCPQKLHIPLENGPKTVAEVMEFVHDHAYADLDRKSEPFLEITDVNESRHLIVRDEIQAIQLVPPIDALREYFNGRAD